MIFFDIFTAIVAGTLFGLHPQTMAIFFGAALVGGVLTFGLTFGVATFFLYLREHVHVPAVSDLFFAAFGVLFMGVIILVAGVWVVSFF